MMMMIIFTQKEKKEREKGEKEGEKRKEKEKKKKILICSQYLCNKLKILIVTLQKTTSPKFIFLVIRADQG